MKFYMDLNLIISLSTQKKNYENQMRCFATWDKILLNCGFFATQDKIHLNCGLREK